MGFAPSQIRDWSFWEYRAVIDGWNEAHAKPDEDEKPPAPSIESLRRAKEIYGSRT